MALGSPRPIRFSLAGDPRIQFEADQAGKSFSTYVREKMEGPPTGGAEIAARLDSIDRQLAALATPHPAPVAAPIPHQPVSATAIKPASPAAPGGPSNALIHEASLLLQAVLADDKRNVAIGEMRRQGKEITSMEGVTLMARMLLTPAQSREVGVKLKAAGIERWTPNAA